MKDEAIKSLSKTMLLIKSLYKSDKIYFYDLIMLALVYDLAREGTATMKGIENSFPEYSYKGRARLASLVVSGYVKDFSLDSARSCDYRLTMKGELLLKRYSEQLDNLVKG